MNNEGHNVTSSDAQEALDSVDKMTNSGWQRGIPKRWLGAAIAVLIGSMFAVYAMDDPGPYIVFPILALPLVIATAREKTGAYGRELPSSRKDKWKLALFAAVLLVVFFASIIVRRTYNVAWVPVVVGLAVAGLVYFASVRERRAYRTQIDRKGRE